MDELFRGFHISNTHNWIFFENLSSPSRHHRRASFATLFSVMTMCLRNVIKIMILLLGCSIKEHSQLDFFLKICRVRLVTEELLLPRCSR